MARHAKMLMTGVHGGATRQIRLNEDADESRPWPHPDYRGAIRSGRRRSRA